MSKIEGDFLKNQAKAASQALPQLTVLADDLEVLARDTTEAIERNLVEDPQRYPLLDPASIMALSFVTKQREHLRSVRILLAGKAHRDARLIARTMLEGAITLQWAFKQKTERPDRWLWFGAIDDWRRIQENEGTGIPIDRDIKAIIEFVRDRRGPNYYEGRIRKALEVAERSGKPFELPDDPWSKNWTAATAKDMFNDIGAKDLYDTQYRHSSEWAHWHVSAILSARASGPWEVGRFTDEDLPAAAAALQLGDLSLLLSLIYLNNHLSLGMTERLTHLMQTAKTIRDQIDLLMNGLSEP